MKKLSFLLCYLLLSFHLIQGLPTLPESTLFGVNLLSGQAVDSEIFDAYQMEGGQIAWISLGGRSASFDYYPSYTEVTEPCGKKTRFEFSPTGAILAQEEWISIEEEWQLYRKQKWIWDLSREVPIAQWVEDNDGRVWAASTYLYDDHSRLVEERLFGNITGHHTQPIQMDKHGLPRIEENESIVRRYQYQEQRLQAIEEQGGRQTLFQYDEEGNVQAQLSAYEGDILLRQFFRRDENGNLIEVISDDGATREIDDLTAITTRHSTLITPSEIQPDQWEPTLVEERFWDPEIGDWCTLHWTHRAFDEKGVLSQETQYDAQNQERQDISWIYNEQGRLIEKVVNGLSQHLSYDDSGLLHETETSETQVKCQFRYDEHRRPIHCSQDFPNGMILSKGFSYDLSGRRVAEMDSFGHSTQWVYDPLGRIVEEIYPNLARVRKRYDLFDRITSYIDENGYETQILYNLHGDPVSVSYPDGTQEQWFYDLQGRVASKVDRNGVVSGYSYDPLGRVTDTAILSNDYDTIQFVCQEFDRSLLKKVFEPNGTVHQFSYDPTGRLESIRRDNGQHSTCRHFEYDAQGKLEAAKDWYGYGVDDYLIASLHDDSIQVYDRGEVLCKELPIQKLQDTQEPTPYDSIQLGEGHSEFILDYINEAGENVLQIHHTEPNGLQRILTFDVMGRVVEEKGLDPFGGLLAWKQVVYDLKGNKTIEFHERGEGVRPLILQWEYGPMDRLERLLEGSDSETRFFYNSQGQLSRRIKPDGTAIQYEYNGLGQLCRLSSSDGSIDYLYYHDEAGNVVEAEDISNQRRTLRSYDGLGHLIYESLDNGLEISSQYDRTGRLQFLELPDQSGVEYQYEGPDLTQIRRLDSQGYWQWTHHMVYDLQGRLTHCDFAGQAGECDWTFSPDGCLESIDSIQWAQYIPEEARLFPSEISQIQWRDPAGLHDSFYTYSYDHQLTTEDGAFEGLYQYDLVKNRTASNDQAVISNERNQITHYGNKAYAYDLNGNLVEEWSTEAHTLYTYDALNRLIRLERDGDIAVNYQYDPFNRRTQAETWIWKQEAQCWLPLETRRFLYHENLEIGSFDLSMQCLELRVLRPTPSGENNASVAIELQGQTYVPIHDHQGSIRCLVDTINGEVKEFYQFSAFGEERCLNRDGEIVSPINPWRFSGKRCDSESGWVYFGRRHYIPSLGRWNSVDPMGYFDGPNLYTYVHNNPLSNKDYFGLFSVSEICESAFKVASQLAWALINSTRNLNKQISERISLVGQVSKDLEAIALHCVGNGLLKVAGYYMESTSYGVVGQGELNDQVRITYINGILNTQSCCRDSAEAISQTHGGSNVHFIHSATAGFTWDVLKGFLAKSGHISTQATMLAHCWKAMIEEMGGVDSGAKILHYAHSMGGTDTVMATNLLDPSERQMIEVISFGSATIIPEDYYGNVVNYISCRDGIPLSDPLGFLRGLFVKESNVIFVGSMQGVPFVDHFFTSPTYQGVLTVLGSQFVETYGYHR